MKSHSGCVSKLTSSLLLLFFLTQAAHALDDPIPAACKGFVTPVNKLTFENEMHRNWYVSWWDGKCEGLPSWPFCQSKPYWSTFVEPVLEANPNADRNSLTQELCKLGEIIGYEFARDNQWRCIDRDDLSAWADLFSSKNENIIWKISDVRSEAKAKIKMAHAPYPCSKQ
jgi:hypothetical protein